MRVSIVSESGVNKLFSICNLFDEMLSNLLDLVLF